MILLYVSRRPPVCPIIRSIRAVSSSLRVEYLKSNWRFGNERGVGIPGAVQGPCDLDGVYAVKSGRAPVEVDPTRDVRAAGRTSGGDRAGRRGRRARLAAAGARRDAQRPAALWRLRSPRAGSRTARWWSWSTCRPSGVRPGWCGDKHRWSAWRPTAPCGRGRSRTRRSHRLGWAMTDRAGRWVTEQVGRWGRTVNEVAVELGCDWHTDQRHRHRLRHRARRRPRPHRPTSPPSASTRRCSPGSGPWRTQAGRPRSSTSARGSSST